jgi:hypothetical protein
MSKDQFLKYAYLPPSTRDRQFYELWTGLCAGVEEDVRQIMGKRFYYAQEKTGRV